MEACIRSCSLFVSCFWIYVLLKLNKVGKKQSAKLTMCLSSGYTVFKIDYDLLS